MSSEDQADTPLPYFTNIVFDSKEYDYVFPEACMLFSAPIHATVGCFTSYFQKLSYPNIEVFIFDESFKLVFR